MCMTLPDAWLCLSVSVLRTLLAARGNCIDACTTKNSEGSRQGLSTVSTVWSCEDNEVPDVEYSCTRDTDTDTAWVWVYLDLR